MKTFKLKSLIILEHEGKQVNELVIPLVDGLIINREDQEARWLIEAYINGSYEAYFNQLQLQEEVMIQVKITKETNEPVTFITSIEGVNIIGDHMNVLFLGKMVDVKRGEAQQVLKQLVGQGLEGEVLLEHFDEKMKR